MNLEPVIGLEIHVQLNTKSKMFCSCSAHASAHDAPNVNVCAICLGHPGTLPVANGEAIRRAVLFGLAIGADVPAHSKFDRKHYFYPDLPKGYQISQYDQPIVRGGRIEGVAITRAHLEEDSAKNIHAGDASLVDFNRASTPLLEIVTEPDLRSPEEAKAFLQELQLLVRTLGISDADMEKGQMRCDANISLREVDGNGNYVGLQYHPKTEVKNINSFRNVERALKFEIDRQTKMWEAGSPPSITTTRGWNGDTMKTVEQRTKEAEADYRYFPEPDIPSLDLSDLLEELRGRVPELPAAKRARFMEEYGFNAADARALVADTALAEFAEQVVSELGGWMESQVNITPEDLPAAQKKFVKLVGNWIINKLAGALNERGGDIRTMKVTAENFAELIGLIGSNQVTQATALKILTQMLESGGDPTHIMEDAKLGKMEDTEALAEVVDRVLANFPQDVERYKAGEVQLIKFFLGMIMKETDGQADPGAAKNILASKLQ